MTRPVMEPAPGSRFVRHVGDRLSVRLRLPGSKSENVRAFLRTNLTRGEVARRETIALLGQTPEDEATFAGASWRDIALERRGESFAIDLPLLEVGHFRAKAYLVDADGHQAWPEGDDLGVSVHPAHTRTANVVYCAFARNFGPTKRLHRALSEARSNLLRPLDDQGYTVIPPSGTLRDLVAEIPHIVDGLGCRILHLLPVGPVPTTHARMGRFGSPYAQLDLTAIDPQLVVFDRRTTGVDQFREVTDAMHARGGLVFLDIVVNHTGWRSTLQEAYPGWFRRDADGSFHSPGAWGNTWADLVELEHHDPALWATIAESLLEWCRRGVDGFRCDAAYMVPVAAWQYLVARVRQEFPDTVFLAEGLGGAWEATEALLSEAGMQWAYSELFQNFEPLEVEGYLDHAFRQSAREGVLVHYSETHDNERLAKRGREHSLFRNRLCALMSVSGAFGFTSGVEWLAEEKIDVHEATGLAFGKEPNLVAELGRLARVLAHHPCFFDGAALERVSSDGSGALVVARASADGKDHGLVVANLGRSREGVSIPLEVWNRGGPKRLDLLGAPLPAVEIAGEDVRFEAPPSACFFLVAKETPSGMSGEEYRRARDAEAFALEALAAVLPQEAIGPADHRALAAIVTRDPERFVGAIHAIDPAAAEIDLVSAIEAALAARPFSNVVSIAPSDRPRITLVPPDAFVLIRDTVPFRVRRVLPGGAARERRSIALGAGHAALLPPIAVAEGALDVTASMRRFGAAPEEHDAILRHVAERPFPAEAAPRGVALLTNGRGGMARIHTDPGHVESKYDALLAANLHPSAPSDRHVFAKRARIWVIADGFLTSLGRAKLLAFEAGPPARWRFAANAGDGRRVVLGMTACMPDGENTTVLRLERERGSAELGPCLPDAAEVRLTVRVDLEDRSFHAETRRGFEAERHFASNVEVLDERRGFLFAPSADRRLRVTCDEGRYHQAPEWAHAEHPFEATRGLVAEGDAYSPGWFEIELGAGESARLVVTAEESSRVHGGADHGSGAERPLAGSDDPFAARLRSAARAFLARRGAGETVIAGFPWFLDWGRDTLIAIRGLVVAGFGEETRAILRTFAALERDGTLPNALSADSTMDRDTSDAPLLFALACGEAARHLGDALLTDPLDDGRTIEDVLVSIARGYLRGCPNGVVVDPESGLPWSPRHFSWMDTNYPAATPREGYPIEIAALFVELLELLDARGLGGSVPRFDDVRKRARASLALFARDDLGFLADTLHAPRGVPAARAQPDDHLRPNMLVPIALGQVRGERARAAVASATRHLLVPGAVRSLAPLPSTHELPIRAASGELLSDPRMPYRGRYEGDEDTSRKPAYHNGTAWVFELATYAEALAAAWDGAEPARRAARAALASSAGLLDSGAIGQLPEILDGDAPHTPRGCDAQAWSVTEILRVWTALRAQRTSRDAPLT